MKLISFFVLVAGLYILSCGDASDKSMSLCTKYEYCCPDSIEIDIWDNHLGLQRIKPIKLTTENKFYVINAFNSAKSIGFQKFEPEYVIRAYYVTGTNPRVFEVYDSNIQEPMNPDAKYWYDIDQKDFGKKLYLNQ